MPARTHGRVEQSCVFSKPAARSDTRESRTIMFCFRNTCAFRHTGESNTHGFQNHLRVKTHGRVEQSYLLFKITCRFRPTGVEDTCFSKSPAHIDTRESPTIMLFCSKSPARSDTRESRTIMSCFRNTYVLRHTGEMNTHRFQNHLRAPTSGRVEQSCFFFTITCALQHTGELNNKFCLFKTTCALRHTG